MRDHPGRDGEGQERDRGEKHPERAAEGDDATAGAIGDMPGNEGHPNEWQGLGQTDHPQRERIVRGREHLPPDDDDLRLARHG